MPATFHILQEGMAGPKVRSTVSLIIDGDHVTVIDPGMAPSQAAILDPLQSHGFEPADVTDVVISHHHPDHLVLVPEVDPAHSAGDTAHGTCIAFLEADRHICRNGKASARSDSMNAGFSTKAG